MRRACHAAKPIVFDIEFDLVKKPWRGRQPVANSEGVKLGKSMKVKLWGVTLMRRLVEDRDQSSLGRLLRKMSPSCAACLLPPRNPGLRVVQVAKGSPAARLIKKDYRLVSVNEEKVMDDHDFNETVQHYLDQGHDKVTVRFEAWHKHAIKGYSREVVQLVDERWQEALLFVAPRVPMGVRWFLQYARARPEGAKRHFVYRPSEVEYVGGGDEEAGLKKVAKEADALKDQLTYEVKDNPVTEKLEEFYENVFGVEDEEENAFDAELAEGRAAVDTPRARSSSRVEQMQRAVERSANARSWKVSRITYSGGAAGSKTTTRVEELDWDGRVGKSDLQDFHRAQLKLQQAIEKKKTNYSFRIWQAGRRGAAYLLRNLMNEELKDAEATVTVSSSSRSSRSRCRRASPSPRASTCSPSSIT